ncbi:MAG TPA: hypothetical protein VLX92_32460 [Kofleriaceae bacterium]|nr:hypothetical protein [Kofleriaceae bacterium]
MVTYGTEHTARPGFDTGARWVNLVLGVWLFISAFIWPHSLGEQTDTWILGLLIFCASIAAMFVPMIRFANTLFAIWLFFATVVIAHSQPGTLWNNCIAAIIVFLMSLVPTGAAPTASGGHRPLPAA